MSEKKPSITAQYLFRLSQLSERQAASRKRLFLAGAFGLCAFLVAIAPARDKKQGALAQQQAQADAQAIARFKRLKDPQQGYAKITELRFSQAGYEAAASWGALTRVEPLPYGMGFFIEHAFASRDTCIAYAPLAAELATRLLIDGRVATASGAGAAEPEALCSTGQNALRLVILDPGALQKKVAERSVSAPDDSANELADPRIPGGFRAQRAAPATAEQLQEAERGAGR